MDVRVVKEAGLRSAAKAHGFDPHSIYFITLKSNKYHLFDDIYFRKSRFIANTPATLRNKNMIRKYLHNSLCCK